TGNLGRVLVNPERPIVALCWAPDSPQLVVGSQNGVIRLWDANQGKMLRPLRTSAGTRVFRLAWAPDGKPLAVCSEAAPVILWATAEWKERAVRKSGEEKSVGDSRIFYGADISWSPDSRRLASSCGNNGVDVWSAERGELLKTLKGAETKRGARAVAWSPDGK